MQYFRERKSKAKNKVCRKEIQYFESGQVRRGDENIELTHLFDRLYPLLRATNSDHFAGPRDP